MRWKAKEYKIRDNPKSGDIKYEIVFSFLPHRTDSTSGPHGWERQWIWLEKIVKVQHWGWLANGWVTDCWYPVNEFTKSLVRNSKW